VVAAIVAAAIVIAALAVIPMSHAFSFSVSACGGLASHDYASGTLVTFHWDEPDGSSVDFGVAKGVYGNASPQYVASGQSGSYSFTSTGGTYTYAVAGGCGGFFSQPSAAVLVAGHWAAPLI
jgi:hypothetical protein